MKYLFCLVFILGAGSAMIFAQKQLPPPPPPAPLIYNAPDKGELKEFLSEDKTFQITFPGVPKINKQATEEAAFMNYLVYRTGSHSIINTADFNFEIESIKEKFYETYKSNLLKSPKTTVQAERDVKIDGRDGKEFDVLSDYQFQKVRILIVGRRAYELKSGVTNWQILSKYNKEKVADFENETARFFNSFKHLKIPEPVAVAVPDDFLGTVGETNYKNTFFNFTIDFPADWHRANSEETEAGKNLGLELFKTDKEKLNKAFEEAARQETIIFFVSDRNSLTPGNPNLGIGVLKQRSSKITKEAIAAVTKDFFLANPLFKLAEDIKEVEINGIKFSTFALNSEINGTKINQKVFITTRNGYSLSVVLSYTNDDGLKAIEKILKSIRNVSK